jgi:pyruvate formate lyase activating enzyme
MAASNDGDVRCGLCPKLCLIRPGESGECRVRINDGGELRAVTYGRPCSVHVDPIEKKPLFHFLPGTPILSLATAGCNLHCQNCQNWEISQCNPEDVPAYDLPPDQVPPLARRKACPSVAYTYTEPLVSFEYVRDCAQACRAAGLRNVLVTAAYLNPGPLTQLAPLIDAANVDIKAMSDAFYRDVCAATLSPVLAAIEKLKAGGVFLEITNLVIPTLNDTDVLFRDLARWVGAHVGAETPLHFSRFFPQHRMTHLPPTPIGILEHAREIARAEGLKHVYIGNAETAGGDDTVCAGCAAALVRRQRYVVAQNRIRDGGCPDCGRRVNGVWT